LNYKGRKNILEFETSNLDNKTSEEVLRLKYLGMPELARNLTRVKSAEYTSVSQM
jgi:hypothetical protein